MDKQNLEKDLKKFGFLPAQAKIYLAGIELGPSLMAHLAIRANLKRSSCYYILPELVRRGFFSIKKIGRRNYYFASPPEKLLQATKAREKLIRKLLPKLKKIANKK